MKITASLLSVFVGVGVGVGVASAGDSGLRSTDQRNLQDGSPEIQAGNGAVTTGADISGGSDCDSIADAVCNLGDQYSTMCDIVKNETAMSSMDFDTKEYTVFIPDDTAWELFQPSMAGLSDAEVGRIVSFHFYEGIDFTYEELDCGETLTAVTGDTSRTKCDKGHGDGIKHQNGNGNFIQGSLPTITNSDIEFCNGVAHTIDHLMLPVHLEEFVPVGSSDDHHKDNPGKMKSNRMLMVFTSNDKLGDTGKKTGWQLPEAAHPYAAFKAAGFVITMASIKGGVAPVDTNFWADEIIDAVNKTFWVEPGDGKKSTETTVKLSDCKTADFDAIFFVGGFGTMWDFPDDPDVHRLVKEFYESGKIVSAVCHGPSALINVKLSNGDFLIKGQEISVFTNDEEAYMKYTKVVPFLCEDRVKENGGTHVKAADVFGVCVAISGDGGRIITGQNPPSAKATGDAIVAAMV